ncbi:MAG: hypothetical protein ABW061_03280 [Polyangiaceae bacterium]
MPNLTNQGPRLVSVPNFCFASSLPIIVSDEQVLHAGVGSPAALNAWFWVPQVPASAEDTI